MIAVLRISRKSVLLLLIGILILPGFATAGSISGALLDQDGNPIEGQVMVEISQDKDDWEDQIFENGAYQFDDLEEGQYVLKGTVLDEEGWFYPTYYPDVWDGNYYAVAAVGVSHLVSTFYPDIAAPGMQLEEVIIIPDEAEIVEVAGDDLEDINILIQMGDGFTSVSHLS